MIPITSKLIPTSTLRRSGIKNSGIKFIVAHDTGNDGSTAANNVNYYINSRNDMQASAHYFVDDAQIINCIPEDEKAWHVQYGAPVDNVMYGVDSNDAALGVELCFSTKKLFDSQKAYENYCDLMADICKRYGLNPTVHIVAHATLDPTRRSDPLNAFGKIGVSWDQFIKDVQKRLAPPEEMVVIKIPKSKWDEIIKYFKDLFKKYVVFTVAH